jgi:hypothetical protein
LHQSRPNHRCKNVATHRSLAGTTGPVACCAEVPLTDPSSAA